MNHPTNEDVAFFRHTILSIVKEYDKWLVNLSNKIIDKKVKERWDDKIRTLKKRGLQPLVISWFFIVNADVNVPDNLKFNINDLKYASIDYINFTLKEVGAKLRITRQDMNHFFITIPSYKFPHPVKSFDEKILDDLYRILDISSNIHGSIPKNLTSSFFDVELFGTKFNTTVTYCSPFDFERGIKNASGLPSLGNFFQYDMESKIYLCNPPYDEVIMKKASERVLEQMRKVSCDVVFVYPGWNIPSEKVEKGRSKVAFPALDLLLASKFKKGYFQENLYFYNYNGKSLFELTNVNVVYLSSNKSSTFNWDKFMESWRKIKNIKDITKLKIRKFPLITDFDEMLQIIKSEPIMNRKKIKPINIDVDDDNPDKEFIIDSWNEMIDFNINNRLNNENLFFYKQIDSFALENTLIYMFQYMKLGIFVRIRSGKVRLIPFANKDFTSNWGEMIVSQLEESGISLDDYKKEKAKVLGYEEKIVPPENWWMNGNMIDNVVSKDVWGEHNIQEIFEMLTSLCEERDIPDIDFFYNKRDHPYLRIDFTTPYRFIHPDLNNVSVADILDFKNDSHPDGSIPSDEIFSLAPIVSSFVSQVNADFPFPTADDWKVMNSQRKGIPWEERKNICFFRGNATGGGVDVKTNQRLRAAKLFGSEDDIFDIGIVSYNVRDKKYSASIPMNFIRPDELGIPLKSFVSYDEQVKYKYHLYIDGHCSSARMSFLMSIGAVIFRVKSLATTPGKSIWYFPLLVENEDYIPIKSDLSDLEEKVKEMIKDQKRSKQMSNNVKFIYDNFIGNKFMFDYLEYLMITMNNMF